MVTVGGKSGTLVTIEMRTNLRVKGVIRHRTGQQLVARRVDRRAAGVVGTVVEYYALRGGFKINPSECVEIVEVSS